MIMKLTSVVLFISLHLFGVESRTWKSHSFPSATWKPSSSLVLPLRGGDQDRHDVPVVPNESIKQDTQQGVARGGSTKTEKYAGGVTVTTPGTITPVSTTTPAENVTEVTEVTEVPLSKPKREKRQKKHKQIAKRLQVRMIRTSD